MEVVQGCLVTGLELNRPCPTRGTALQMASRQPDPALLRLLLGLGPGWGLEVNARGSKAVSALGIACAHNNSTAVQLLLEDPRVDVAAISQSHISPFWWIHFCHDLGLVKIFLASGRPMQLTLRQVKNLREPLAAALLTKYLENPAQTARQLRRELGWILPGARLLALVIFVCDEFLEAKAAA